MAKVHNNKSVVLHRISGHLGSGQFGRVEQGVLRVENCDIQVALKTLNNSATDDGQLKFLQEAAIMAQFRHPNVILLYGIVCKSEPVSPKYYSYHRERNIHDQ